MSVVATPFGLLAINHINREVQKTKCFSDTSITNQALFRFLNKSGYKLIDGYYM